MEVNRQHMTHASQRVRSNKYRLPLVVIVALIVAALIGLFVVNLLGQQRINKGEFQAVYMVSGQIYFGKLQNTSGDYLVLKDIYLAQSNNTDQSTKSTDGSTSLQPASTGIIKATEQVYGPEDSMAIRSSQVQFWQNLRSNSKVTQAINTTEKK